MKISVWIVWLWVVSEFVASMEEIFNERKQQKTKQEVSGTEWLSYTEHFVNNVHIRTIN